MFRKLMKHEFKSISKYACGYAAVMMIASILAGVLDRSFEEKYDIDIWVILFVVYMAAIMVVPVVFWLKTGHNYNNSMFMDKGYLTHTIPVSYEKLFGAKVLAGCINIILGLVISCLSYFVYILTVSSFAGLKDILEVIASFGKPLYYYADATIISGENAFVPMKIFVGFILVIGAVLMLYTICFATHYYNSKKKMLGTGLILLSIVPDIIVIVAFANEYINKYSRMIDSAIIRFGSDGVGVAPGYVTYQDELMNAVHQFNGFMCGFIIVMLIVYVAKYLINVSLLKKNLDMIN